LCRTAFQAHLDNEVREVVISQMSVEAVGRT